MADNAVRARGQDRDRAVPPKSVPSSYGSALDSSVPFRPLAIRVVADASSGVERLGQSNGERGDVDDDQDGSDTKLISLTLNMAHLIVGLGSLILAIVIAAVSVTSSIRSQIEDAEDGLRTEMREAHGQFRAEMTDAYKGLRSEMTDAYNGLRSEIASVRSELRSEIAGLRSDFRSEIGALREEMGSLRSDLGALRKEVAEIRVILARIAPPGGHT